MCKEIIYFATGEKKSILAIVIRRFLLVANDTFHKKGEKNVVCNSSKRWKVRFSGLRYEKVILKLPNQVKIA